MSDFLTMDSEEVLRRWHELTKPRGPRSVFMRDGQIIAGEAIRRGELVYFQSSAPSAKKVIE